MKYTKIIALGALVAVAAIFSCPVTFINDTETVVFAFDEAYNEGNILAPGARHIYGDEKRHPVVTFYTQLPNSSYKKSYRIIQIACALFPIDKTVTLSGAMKGDLNKAVFEVKDFTVNPEVLPCCQHEGAGHDMAPMKADEPLNTMDEE